MCPAHVPHITIHNLMEEVSKEFKDKDEQNFTCGFQYAVTEACHVWVECGGWAPLSPSLLNCPFIVQYKRC